MAHNGDFFEAKNVTGCAFVAEGAISGIAKATFGVASGISNSYLLMTSLSSQTTGCEGR